MRRRSRSHGTLRARWHGDRARCVEPERRRSPGGRHALCPRGGQHRGPGLRVRRAGPRRQLRRGVGADRARGSSAGHPLVGRVSDRGRRPNVGRDRGVNDGARRRSRRTPSRRSPTSPSWSPRRSRTPTRRPDSSPRARGWSPPPTMLAAASCATCTMALNSASSTRSSRSSSRGRRKRRGDEEVAKARVSEALEETAQANAELRELAHGILPAVLARGGLKAGVGALDHAGPRASQRRRPQGAVSDRHRGHRLLRGRRSADERRQALPAPRPRT